MGNMFIFDLILFFLVVGVVSVSVSYSFRWFSFVRTVFVVQFLFVQFLAELRRFLSAKV